MRIAVVIQRFAADVTGGAEYHARRVAEHLAAVGHEVTVLTSTSRSSLGAWDDHYPAGRSRDGSITVLRFRTLPRAWRNIERIGESLRAIASRSPASLRQIWSMWANPYVPGLIAHLRDQGHRYQAVFFFTYYYYPSLVGAVTLARLPSTRRPLCIGVPLAHDDAEVGTPVVRRMLRAFDSILVNTEEERDLIARLLGDTQTPIEVAGCGVDEPPETIAEAPLAAPYVVYLGRRKDGTEILPAAIAEFRRRFADDTFEAHDGRTFFGRDLVLVTVGDLELASPGIHCVGHVDVATRWAWSKGAELLVNPSLYESLSLTLLESWWVGRPVLARGQCLVMANQVARAGGGATFDDATGFADALAILLRSRAARAEMGARGGEYARSRYRWSTVIAHYGRALTLPRGVRTKPTT